MSFVFVLNENPKIKHKLTQNELNTRNVIALKRFLKNLLR